MLTRRIQRSRQVLSINLPSQICEMLNLKKGDELSVKTKDENIILTRIPTN